MKKENFVIGIDFGATNIKGALVKEDGNIIEEISTNTNPSYTEESLANHLYGIISSLLSSSENYSNELLGIGIGIPGTINIKEGLIVESPNIKLRNVSVVQNLKRLLPFPMIMDNDANVAAIGEKVFGEGQNVSNFICLTLGTGIGGGIFINGNIYRGFSDSAGEVGHMIIDMNGEKCGCGTYGCLESMASGTALAREAKNYFARNKNSITNKLVSENIDEIKGEYVTEAAQQGEIGAQNILREIGKYLGIGLVGLINVLNPEKIIFAGSLAKINIILESTKDTLQKHSYFKNIRSVKLVTSKLKNKAGILGAAGLALSEFSNDSFRV